MNHGVLLQALTNAVLALYGEPEPHHSDELDEIAGRLNRLAEQKRMEDAG